jgi:hypothetical protein
MNPATTHIFREWIKDRCWHRPISSKNNIFGVRAGAVPTPEMDIAGIDINLSSKMFGTAAVIPLFLLDIFWSLQLEFRPFVCIGIYIYSKSFDLFNSSLKQLLKLQFIALGFEYPLLY